MTGRTCGASRSENAGMSNERWVRIPSAARLRFPGAGLSAQGKSGPKARPTGVVDGQQVEIPVLHRIVMSDGGTQEAISAWCWIHVQATSFGMSQMLIPSRASRDEERNYSSEG